MRKELEQIALIEAILEGKISESELGEKNSSVLIKEQETLVDSIKTNALITLIKKEQKAWKVKANIKKWGLIIVTMIAVGLIGYYISNQFDNNESSLGINEPEIEKPKLNTIEDTLKLPEETPCETSKTNENPSNPTTNFASTKRKSAPKNIKNSDSLFNSWLAQVATSKNDLIDLSKPGKVTRERIPLITEQSFQTFIINPQKDTIIIGEKGTKILIPANSILTKKGLPMRRKTTIKLREYYTKWDFLNSDLTAQTIDDELLESGGMIQLNAFAGKQTVDIDESNPFRILFNNSMDSMKTFYGDNKDVIKWEEGNIQSGNDIGDSRKMKFTKSSKRPLKEDETGWRRKNKVEYKTKYAYKMSLSKKYKAFDINKFIQSKLEYPKNTRNSQLHGMVYLSYEIDQFAPTNIQVLQSTSNTFSQKAIEALKQVGNYMPLDFKADNPKHKYILEVPYYGKEVNKEELLKDVFETNVDTTRKKSENVIPPIKIIGEGSDYTIKELVKLKFPLNKKSQIKHSKENKQSLKFNKQLIKAKKEGLLVYKFNWINCDRFYEDKRPKVDLIVEKDSSFQTFLSFDQINSCMRPLQVNGAYAFNNIPKGMKITITQLGLDEKYRRKMRIWKGKTKNGRIEMPEWIPYDEKAIKAALK